MKIAVSGLPLHCTKNDMLGYFGQFGTVVDAVVMLGRGTGHVKYDTDDTARTVLGQEHFLGDRKIEVQEAANEVSNSAGKGGGGWGAGAWEAASGGFGFGGSISPMPEVFSKDGGGKGVRFGTKRALCKFFLEDMCQKATGCRYAHHESELAPDAGSLPSDKGKGREKGRGKGQGHIGPSDKIFIGGLPLTCDDEMIITYFSKYGRLVDAVVMKDKVTGNNRGFGFVRFDNFESAEKVLLDRDIHQLNGKFVECTKATPQSDPGKGYAKGVRDGVVETRGVESSPHPCYVPPAEGSAEAEQSASWDATQRAAMGGVFGDSSACGKGGNDGKDSWGKGGKDSWGGKDGGGKDSWGKGGKGSFLDSLMEGLLAGLGDKGKGGKGGSDSWGKGGKDGKEDKGKGYAPY